MIRNLLLLLFSTAVALGLAELVVTLAGLPPTPLEYHSSPPQFSFRPGSNFGYVNKPSTDIRFVYDQDTRGYFGPDSTVSHKTNKLGFRGPMFARERKEGTLRLVFLGDSFTFGEGVHFPDTYAEQTKKRLLELGYDTEAFNFGVGGFNTRQEAALLKQLAIQSKPDIVVVGFTMNDAEPELFYIDRAARKYRRRPREKLVKEGGATPIPPDSFIFHSRLVRFVWQQLQNRKQTDNTINWYHRLYEPQNPDWLATQTAITSLSEQCKKADIPCVAVLFPLLYRLDDYPLLDEHARIKAVLQDNDFVVADLLPVLTGMDASTLRVHPTDHHPNEIVHRLAAETLVRTLQDSGLLP